MSASSPRFPDGSMQPPDREFFNLLEIQFARIGGLLLEQCQQPVPVPPQFQTDYPQGVFLVDTDVLAVELEKGVAGRLSLRLEGPYHTFGHSIAGAESGRPFAFERTGGVIRLDLYTDKPLVPVVYGNVARCRASGGDENEPVATVFAADEMPSVITDSHELIEANQQRASAGELRDLRRGPHIAAHPLADYNKVLDDAVLKPHYLDQADKTAIIQMLEVTGPNVGWTLDTNYWLLK